MEGQSYKIYNSLFYRVIEVGCIIVGIYAVGTGLCDNSTSLSDIIAYGLLALSGLMYFAGMLWARQRNSILMWIVLILQIGVAGYSAIMH